MRIVSLRALQRDPPDEPAMVTKGGAVIGTWTPADWENRLARERLLAHVAGQLAQLRAGPAEIPKDPSPLHRLWTRFGR